DKVLSEQALKRMVEDAFGPLMGPARPGDSWITRRQVDMGRAGTYQKQLRCTYEGKEDNLDKIPARVTTEYIPPGEQRGVERLPSSIQKENLSGSGTGFLYFDRTKGRLTSSVISVTWGGTLGMEIGGQTMRVDLLQTEQTSVRTTDANPIGAAPMRKENEPLQ